MLRRSQTPLVAQTGIMSSKPDSRSQKLGRAARNTAFCLSLPTTLAWCGKTLWPWLIEQAAHWRNGQELAWPKSGQECLALIGFLAIPFAWFGMYFAWRVWKEIEEDQKLYQVTASRIAAFPPMAVDLAGRWKDWAIGSIGFWFSSFSFRRRYLRELPRLRKLLDVRNLVMTQANHLELEDVYIELKTASRSIGSLAEANPVTRELRHERDSIWAYLRNLDDGIALAIVGAPGSGKTTLLKHLLLKYAWNQQWRFRVRTRIPFFVELRKLPKHLLKTESSNTLPAVLYRLLKDESDLKTLWRHCPNDWLSNQLRRGCCILLCDGLDEIADTQVRQRVSKWLNEQINHTDWHKNIFLITARPAGYASAPLTHVLNLEVQPFDWNDTRAFIQRWYQANRSITMKPGTPRREILAHAMKDAETLLTRLRDHARLSVLTSNPLLLTMVCLMHEMGQLPGSRSQLYKEICEVHLERWRRRTSSAEEPNRKETWNAEQKLSVLRPLARQLMLRGSSKSASDSKRLTTSEMLSTGKAALDHIGLSTDETSRKDFFQHLHDESGLWLQFEPDEWGFAHLSFQEYLCADSWCSNPSFTPKENEWSKYYEQSWWRECLLLYACKTTDIRPLLRAALNTKTPRSLSFLFALEGENVSIPSDLQDLVAKELELALKSQTTEVFNPAAEAWLLRQQDMNYFRYDERRDLSGWVTQAEYQLFLNSKSGRATYALYPLHQVKRYFNGSPKEAALGMTGSAAHIYCDWLNRRFPEYQHRLGNADVEGNNFLKHEINSSWIISIENTLSRDGEVGFIHRY